MILRRFQDVDARRVHLTMTWVVSLSILSEFGRRAPRNKLQAFSRPNLTYNGMSTSQSDPVFGS